jgi:DNA-binding NtrC family response regulator
MSEPQAPLKLGLLDDDLGIRESASNLLRLSQVDVTTFRTCESLIEAIRGEEFDAFVVDWRLQEGTAGAALAAIRADARNRSAEVVIITGELVDGDFIADPEIAAAAQEFDCSARMKPVRWRAVADDLRQARQERGLRGLADPQAARGNGNDAM